jgi:hypothetical protein
LEKAFSIASMPRIYMLARTSSNLIDRPTAWHWGRMADWPSVVMRFRLWCELIMKESPAREDRNHWTRKPRKLLCWEPYQETPSEDIGDLVFTVMRSQVREFATAL